MCSIVSKLAEIREMDAEQIREEAQLLQDSINACISSSDVRMLSEAYRENYRHLTGKELILRNNTAA